MGALPTLRQQAPAVTSAASSTSAAVTLPSTAVAGNLLVFCMAGDKNTGALTLSGWSKPVELLSSSVSLYMAWKVAAGGETAITASWASASAAGNTLWAGEYEQDGAAAWTLMASATHITDEATASSWSSGTTGPAVKAGLGIAAFAVDSAGNPNNSTLTWTNGYVTRHINGASAVGGPGGIYVAELPVAAGATTGTTLAYTSGTADQWSGAVLVLGRDNAPGPTPGTLVSTWLGIDTLTVKTSGGAGDARVAFSTDPSMTAPVYSSPAVTPDAQGVSKHTIPALTPDTTYYYRVEHSGTLIGTAQQFRSMPGGSFTFGFASCRLHDGDSAVLADVFTRGCNLFIQHGDLHYREINTTDASIYRNAYDEPFTQANLGAVLRRVPNTYTWSDHDFCGGLSDSTAIGKATAQQVYRERVPHPALPSATGGIYHTFRVGRVRFIVLDARSFRSPASAPDGPSKVLLGAEQRTWLQGLLDTPDTPLTFVVSEVPWIGTAGADDSWGFYPDEQAQVAAMLAAAPTKIVMLCGDAHMLAIDDGTNSPGGVPVWHAAALRQTGSVKGGPYSGGTLPGSPQYGFVQVVDNGSQITATYSGIKSDLTVWNTHAVSTPATGSLRVGSVTPSGIYVGAQEASRVYVGTVQVWP